MKNLIKLFIPPIFLEIKHWFIQHPSWLGIYDKWEDVPNTNPWTGRYWLLTSANKLVKSIAAKGPSPISYRSIVTLLINNITRRGRAARVLDWGGGTGLIYHDIRRDLMQDELVDWIVVEDPGPIRSMGEKDAISRMSFYGFSQLRYIPGKIDIVHVNTTMQYVKDYEAAISSMISAGMSPKYFVFTRLLAGRLPAPKIIVMQKIGDETTPCAFLDVNTFIRFFGTLGYDPIFISKEDKLAGRYDNSVPKEFRIPYELNIVFKRRLI